MMEALRSSETSVLTRAARRNIPEDAIIHSHSRENLKSYLKIDVWNCVCALLVEGALLLGGPEMPIGFSVA
jgi:hypothetical protein